MLSSTHLGMPWLKHSLIPSHSAAASGTWCWGTANQPEKADRVMYQHRLPPTQTLSCTVFVILESERLANIFPLKIRIVSFSFQT